MFLLILSIIVIIYNLGIHKSMNKIISFLNYKGGVGRSTVVLNLAKALTIQGKKVLCLDLDPKADLTYTLFYKHEFNKNLYDVFNDTTLNLSDIVKNSKHGFFIAPSGKNMDNLEFSLIGSKDFIPHKRLKNIFNNSYLNDYDYTLIDTPSFPSIININAITVSDFIIIPINLDYNCLNAVNLLFNTFTNISSVNNVAFIINKFDKRESINDEVLKKFQEKYYSEYLFKTKIRTDCKYKILLDRQKTIFDLEPPRGKGYLDFTDFGDELINLLDTRKEKSNFESYSI